MSSGDADAVEAFYSLSPLAVSVGTDSAEFWTDPVRHNADVRRFFDGSNGTLRWEAGDVLARASGDLGWVVDRPAVAMPSGETFALRLTLVWQRIGREWLVVHSHASLGA
jgi:hypothetical protein